MHVVSAASAFGLLAATLWMMKADYTDEWRGIQSTAYKLQAQQIDEDLTSLSDDEFKQKESELKRNVVEAQNVVKEKKDEVAKAQKEVDHFDGQFQKLSRDVKFKRAEKDATRAVLDLAVRDGQLGKALAPKQKDFDDIEATVDKLEIELQELQANFDAAKDKLAQLTRPRDEAQAALKKHETELVRLNKAKDKIDPPFFSAAGFKHALMEVPIIEGFNGPLKPAQIWLPDLTINYGGAKDVARFDRCTTCHVNIDRVGTGNVPAFPLDKHGISMDNADDYLHAKEQTTTDGSVVKKKKSRVKSDGSKIGYANPFATHPNPELFLTSASPHPMQKFGCTSCHEGQGSGTSFQNASHAPVSPDVGENWHKKYGYAANHFWEYPMYPKRLGEAACLKCHHNVVELGVNPKFGESAPRLFKGYELIRQYGCFGCHEINGFASGKPIGPDMRLEPQTPEEAKRIAADPTAVAGTMRKVGPGLRHLASKTNKAWTENWVEEPKRFRPETRMPQFFNLTNQTDAHAKLLQPVEIAGIVAYLFDKSEKAKGDHWAEGYNPDASRGKRLFSERGCMACHSHDDFPGIKADFGPNLTNAHQKISSMEWLYSWLREPTRHSERTRMPNLYLEPETVNDVTTDPAADIAAFLLSNRDDQGKLLADAEGKPVGDKVGPGRFKQIAWDKKGMEKLARLYLSKVMTQAKVDETLSTRMYPAKEANAIKDLKEDAIKPDEVELVNGPITDESMLQYIGRRSVSRYGCYGCHDIPGFEKARPIGTGLQDWGRKDPTKLALEHIEEFLHHHGEADNSSTARRAENALKDGLNNNFDSPEQRDREGAVAYFFDQLNSHGRAGFLWQKLRDPRSYDYKKIETKGYDERLRMPKFPFSETDIEAIATFVLGLVAEPPAEKYVYRPQGPAKARIEGEKLLAKYNCTGCHMVELPEITGLPEDLTPYELGPSDFQQAFDLLVKLRKPRDARTNLKLPNGDAAIRFHAMLVQPADPSDDPEDQSSFYDLWEPIALDSPVGPDGKDIPAAQRKLMLPPNRIEMKVKKLVSATHGRGGAFAEWLVDASMKGNSGVNVERSVAREMAPPTLFEEGIKAQTPWLYSFLKNPDRLRYTTVLRMPQFNMSNDEAEKLANYFSAVDGTPYPYQEVRERDPDYLADKEHDHPGYLHDGWQVITMPPPTGFCAGCHSVGGREFAGGDPSKVTRGPNLDRVSSRLRPDWLRLWLYNPKLITPYTRMPQNFTRDKQVFPQLFGGNGEEQAGAASDALMNYLRLLEKEGKATAAAPADAAGGNQ